MTEAVVLFEEFFEDFRKDPLWLAMVNTRENSPWHREENVGVHTQMLLTWYARNLRTHRSDRQRVLTMVACLFHDTGKPVARVEKFSEERGKYFAFHGHELISARLWTDYAMRNKTKVEKQLRLSLFDVANIALMLEYHVPWQLKDQKKRLALKKAFMSRMGESGHRAWLDLLLADQHGRIADGQAEKLAEVETWLTNWEAL